MAVTLDGTHHDGKGMYTYHFDELLYSFSAVLVGILGSALDDTFFPAWLSAQIAMRA